VITPVYDPEFLLSNDQVLETIAKSGISQSSFRTFQLTPTRQDDSNNQLNGDIDHVAKEQSSDQLSIYLPTIISTSEYVDVRQVLNFSL